MPSTTTAPTPSLEADLLLACGRARPDEAAITSIRSLLRAGPDWDALLRLAASHATVPLLRVGLEAAGFDQVPETTRRMLTAWTAQFARKRLYLIAELFRILEELDGRGIPAVTFKGPVLGAVCYGDPALRDFIDLDLLVRSHDVSGAVELLAARGFEHAIPMGQAERAAWRRTRYAFPMRREGDRVQVDLHWAFARRHFSLDIPTELLWRETSVQRLSGRLVRTFTPEMHLLTMCVHGAKSGPRPWPKLKWICDVAALLDKHPHIDWERTEALARTLGIQRILLLGLAVAEELLDAPVPPHVAAVARKDRVHQLATTVKDDLFDPDPGMPVLQRMLFDMRIRERYRDKLRYSLRRAFTPTARDREAASVPRRLDFAYVPLRVLRLLRSYALRPSRIRKHRKKE